VTAAEDAPPLLTVSSDGRLRAWLSGRTVAALGAVVLLLATGGAYAVRDKLPALGRKGAKPAPTTVAQVAVRRPFVLVEVFPHRGGDGGKGAAEAAQRKLAGAGMTVRLVDSLATDAVADDAGGFWVLLQDGFADAGQAEAYCARFRAVAPKCRLAS
jgi:hypothetical protein